jgi:endonuclease YncB( thermonuclease family)
MSRWDWPDSVVTRIVDGDTFVATVHRDLGFGGRASFDVRLRLAGINTPPAKTAEGSAAAGVATELMLGKTLHIVTLGPYKYGADDSPGEWMAQVTLEDGRDVAHELVAAGVGVTWDGKGPRPGG